MRRETWTAGSAAAARLRALAFTAAFSLLLPPIGAHAQCSETVPASVKVHSGNRVLFYGDSITVGIVGTPYHYAVLVQNILASSYCPFELFEVEAIGQRGSHYIRYARRIGRDLATSDIPYDWVMFQDSGRALKLFFAQNPDSPRSFPVALQNTIDAARASEPSVGIMLATTPPLDHANATSSWEVRYQRVNDFDDHNAIVRDVAEDDGHILVSWATDACRAYAEAPVADWTRDGVHPQPYGEALFALSIVKSLGVPRADLRLGDLQQFHWSLDELTMSMIADWVYAPNPACD